jgi:hypothetical protein
MHPRPIGNTGSTFTTAKIENALLSYFISAVFAAHRLMSL